MEEDRLKRLYEEEFRKAYDSGDKKEAIRIIGENRGVVNYLSPQEDTTLFRAVLGRMLDKMIDALDMEDACLK
ncbi:MAG: hypothetical protein AABW47_00380 [Nanoarchaeota archaeon]